MSGRLVDKIIMILSFRVGISKNNSIDHRVKETCAIMSTQVTCETDNISLHVIQQFQIHQIFVFHVFHCNLKE